MKRTTVVAALLAMGLLMAAPFAAAQQAASASASQAEPAPAVPQQAPVSPMTPMFAPAPVATPSQGGQVSLMLFDATSVDSAKFEEYRQVPRGVSIPFFNLFANNDKIDFSLVGQKAFQTDQRYTGWANFSWLGVAFDYNQIPHNMGNNGHTILNETAPNVWSMSATLRQALSDAVDKTSSTARTYPFFNNLFAPTIAAANSVDIVQERKRGAMDIDLGQKLPFGLNLTYVRDVKTGSRGASGGDIVSVVTMSPDVLEPVNEVTQDYGIRWAYNRKMANVYATFNRNVYNDRLDSLVIDNPLRATNSAYTGKPPASNPAQVRFGAPPDNEASRGSFGGMLKFARQTRLSGDVALGRWTQNAQFLPFTINSAIRTDSGQPADSLSVLPQSSLDGKINTTMVNLGFSSRPVTGLGVRARYRLYDMANKTSVINWTGTTASSPDRAWETATAGEFATASPYSAKTQRFDAQAGYDYKALTVEGSLQHVTIDRTFREAASDAETGYGAAGVFHAKDWVALRAFIDHFHRTPHDAEVDVWGLQADLAERNRNRVGLEIEITPADAYGFNFTYSRRHDEYPNRPVRPVIGDGSAPSGLLDAAYDVFTVEFDYTPGARAELTAFYTYEKNTATNQRLFTTPTGVSSGAANATFFNVLGFNQSDKGNTFGVGAVYHIVPDKWDVLFNAQRQKVDGLMGIAANQAQGTAAQSFYLSRTSNGFPGPQDITDFDDTTMTTVLAQLNRTIAKVWTLSVGYAYEQYDFADAFSSAPEIFPQAVLFFLKANNGPYKASMGFAKLNYRF